MNRSLTLLLCLLLVACSSSKKGKEKTAASKATTETNDGPPSVNDNVIQEDPVVVESPESPQYPEQKATPETGRHAIWQQRDPYTLPDLERRVTATKFESYYCDYDLFLRLLEGEEPTVSLPLLSGMTQFQLKDASTMSPELAAKFPNVKSYKGKSADGKLAIRLDTNEEGLFVEVRGTNRKELISPLLKGSKQYYAVYSEDDLPPGPPRTEDYD